MTLFTTVPSARITKAVRIALGLVLTFVPILLVVLIKWGVILMWYDVIADGCVIYTTRNRSTALEALQMASERFPYLEELFIRSSRDFDSLPSDFIRLERGGEC